MTTPKIENKVLIVGAGPAGLTLAQILRRRGIAYEIFERDPSLHSRGQGWAVLLHRCLPRLKSLLDLPDCLGDLSKTSVNAGVNEYDKWTVMDAVSGQPISTIGGVSPSEPGYILRVRREKLRDFLWEGLGVSTAKQFTRYVEDEAGVTAYFRDGTSARGSILVGADGASSHVRSQFIHQQHQVAPYIPIIGICTLTREQYAPLRELGNAAIVSGMAGLRYLIGLLSIEPDRSSALYYYAVCYHSERPEEDAAWAADASKTDLYAKALEVTANVPSHLTEIIRITGEEGVATPPLRFVEFTPPEGLPKGRVMLIGDGAHSMMPFQGAGANTAIEDACDLAELLVNNANTDSGVSDENLLQDFAKQILPRARQAVQESHAAGEKMNTILGAT